MPNSFKHERPEVREWLIFLWDLASVAFLVLTKKKFEFFFFLEGGGDEDTKDLWRFGKYVQVLEILPQYVAKTFKI